MPLHYIKREAVMQCIQFYLSWKIQRYAIDLPFNVFTIQYMSIFSNYNMIKGSKGIIDACLHAIRCIP